MLSPKQLLALEASNESRNTPLRLQSTKEHYPLPPDDKIITFDGFKAPLLQEDSRPISLHMDRQRDILDNQIAGKQGCIYRQHESQLLKIFPGVSPVYKVWVSIEGRKLLYCPIESQVNQAFLNCKGFLELDSDTEVRVKYLTTPAFESVDKDNAEHLPSADRMYYFVVKQKDISIVLCVESNDDREEWLAVIRQASNGISHYLPRPKIRFPQVKPPLLQERKSATLSAPSGSTLQGPPGLERGLGSSQAEIDYPHKEGYLKKTSSGNSTLGIMKSVKNRWFRLEGGELRYYESMDARPTTLKGTVNLVGASVSDIDSNNCISLQLSSEGQGNGRLMRLEAVTPKVALEWQNALAETCILLKRSPTGASPTAASFAAPTGGGKAPEVVAAVKRRQNIHDSVTFEEELTLTGTTTTTTTTTTTPATRRGSAFSFSKGNDTRTSSSNAVGSAGGGSGLASLNFGDIRKTERTVGMIVQCLKQHFLLKTVRDTNSIVERMQPLVAAPGEVIIWQGTTGNYFYFLESGQCDVIKDGSRISYVFPGKSFGELALLNSATRQATIRASQVSQLWFLDRKDFRLVLAEQENAFLSEKIQFLRNVELFKKLLPTNIEKIAQVMELKTYNLGDKLIAQGDAGDAFYMMQSGRVTITQTQSTKTGFSSSATVKELARLGPGQSFGELALMEDAPRKATVTASSDTVQCWTVDRESFLHIFGSFKEAEDENVGIAMLRKVKILESLSDKHLLTLSRCLVHCNFKADDIIIKQGDIGDSFYLISSGEVSVQVNHIQVAALNSGAFFGEMALLSNERRSATVVSKGDTECLMLSRDDFNTHLGDSLEHLLQAEAKKRRQQQQQQQQPGGGMLMEKLRRVSLFSTSPSAGSTSPSSLTSLSPSTTKTLSTESNSQSPPCRSRNGTNRMADNEYFLSTRSMFSLHQLHRLKQLGNGTFATVFLVQHTVTNKFYAMKALNKKDSLQKQQMENVFSERDIMLLFLDCDFVAALYATLQDEKSLYFVQQFVPGGDLFSLLHSPRLSSSKLGGLASQQAAFYLANTLVILEYLHEQEVVHRDLKPENFMLDSKGYLKLVDFGSAKLLPVGFKTNTLCGCALYLAPEIILSKGYTKSVDFWSLGILLFELLTRKTPFAHDNIAMIYQNIVESEENLKCVFSGSGAGSFGNFDANPKSLLLALLTNSPLMRLGMLRNGIDEIWAQPMLKSYSSESVNKRTVGAVPFIPPAVDSMQLLEDCELDGLLDSLNTEVDLSSENPEESGELHRRKGNKEDDCEFAGF